MNYQLIILFVVLSFVNVILQTVKSLLTVNGTRLVAAIANCIAFGLYTVVVVYTVCDLPLWLKVIITMATNFVGVYVSFWLVKKFTKDKLWKIDVSVPTMFENAVISDFSNVKNKVPYSVIKVNNNWSLFSFYCNTQKESQTVKNICKQYNAKFFASESKVL